LDPKSKYFEKYTGSYQDFAKLKGEFTPIAFFCLKDPFNLGNVFALDYDGSTSGLGLRSDHVTLLFRQEVDARLLTNGTHISVSSMVDLFIIERWQMRASTGIFPDWIFGKDDKNVQLVLDDIDRLGSDWIRFELRLIASGIDQNVSNDSKRATIKKLRNVLLQFSDEMLPEEKEVFERASDAFKDLKQYSRRLKTFNL
jgi:hypothetical protein